MRSAFLLPVAVASAFFVFGACSSEHDPIDTTKLNFDSGGQFLLDAPLHPDASCFVEINTVPIPPVSHVPIGTEITYNSNPPAGGPHYPVWVSWQDYSTPVDRRNYVHNLEHGGVALLYKCDQPDGCPTIVEGLRNVRLTMPEDPICTPLGLRNRVIVTPDPLLDVPVAVATWGWTYKAQCLDVPTLLQFANEHYGQGSEVTCAQGGTMNN